MVAMPGCRAKLQGELMKNRITGSMAMFVAGALTMAALYGLVVPRTAQAPVANGNDKFTMVTVLTQETGNQEAVFVLNHLTGLLVGGVINDQTGKFAHRYVQNVALDFQAASREPKYAIVTGPANLRASGGVAPAFGVIYVAELSSGAVIAYGMPRPTNRNAGATMELVRLDAFQFAESIGQ